MKKVLLSTACVIFALLLAVPFTAVAQITEAADYKTEAGNLPEQKIQLDVAAAQNVTLVDDVEKGKVVSLAEGDQVTWLFDIAAAGNYLISVDYKALPDTYDTVGVDLLSTASFPLRRRQIFRLSVAG